MEMANGACDELATVVDEHSESYACGTICTAKIALDLYDKKSIDCQIVDRCEANVSKILIVPTSKELRIHIKSIQFYCDNRRSTYKIFLTIGEASTKFFLYI